MDYAYSSEMFSPKKIRDGSLICKYANYCPVRSTHSSVYNSIVMPICRMEFIVFLLYA